MVLPSKNNPDADRHAAEVVFAHILRQATLPEDASYDSVLRVCGRADPFLKPHLRAADEKKPCVRRLHVVGAGRELGRLAVLVPARSAPNVWDDPGVAWQLHAIPAA